MARNHVPLFLAAIVAAIAIAGAPAHAQLTGPLTERWWAIPGGGGMHNTGGAYSLAGAVGQPGADVMAGGVYRIRGGVWAQPLSSFVGAPGGPPAPATFALAAPRPNPFHTATALSFDVPARSWVTAEVFDLRGRRVRTLVDEMREAGRYRESWDGTDAGGGAVGSAIYFIRVRAGEAEATQRVAHVH